MSNKEIELKLIIPASHLDRLKRHPVLREAKEGRRFSRVSLYSTYFDTPGLYLAKQGAALRIRKSSTGHFEQTVKKKAGPDGDIFTRGEWNAPSPDGQIDPMMFDDVAIRDLLLHPKVSQKLQPIFTTDVERQLVDLSFKGSQIEMAIDQGAIRTDDQSVSVDEVEFELKSGKTDHLYELVMAFEDKAMMRLCSQSKAARGRALYLNKEPSHRKSKSCELISGMSAEEALQQMMREVLKQLLANEAVVRHSDRPIGVHQLRVANRRLRTILTFFSGVIPKAAENHLKSLARQVMRPLGVARDLDVFLGETIEQAETHFQGQLPGLAMLRAEAERRRAIARQDVLEMLDGPVYAELTVALGAWSVGTPWKEGISSEGMKVMRKPVNDLAARLLEKNWKRVHAMGARHDQLPLAALHMWRLKVKRMRYASDFFSEVWATGKAKKFATALAKLQDILGYLNDAEVARLMMIDFAPALRDDAAKLAAGGIIGFTHGHAELALKDLEAVWSELDDRKHFWH